MAVATHGRSTSYSNKQEDHALSLVDHFTSFFCCYYVKPLFFVAIYLSCLTFTFCIST